MARAGAGLGAGAKGTRCGELSDSLKNIEFGELNENLGNEG